MDEKNSNVDEKQNNADDLKYDNDDYYANNEMIADDDLDEETLQRLINEYLVNNNSDEKPKKKKKKKNGFFDPFEVNVFKVDRYQSEALLKTLNAIGKDEFHFNNFNDSVMNDSIPKFVMFFFKIKSIQKVKLTNLSQNDQELNQTEIENINATIEFLKAKDPRFQVLKFDFEDKKSIQYSTKLFYYNFLNSFFVTRTKEEIYERINSLFNTKYKFNPKYINRILKDPIIIQCLLHFYNEKNLHFDVKEMPVYNIESCFEKAKIPMIVSMEVLEDYNLTKWCDHLLYQYQFIFDAIDSGPKILFIIESLMHSIYTLSKINVPKFEMIPRIILSKRSSLEFLNLKFDQYCKKIEVTNSSENIENEPIKKHTILSTYELRTRMKETDQKNSNQSKCDKNSNKILSFDQFWIPKDLGFGYDNGILFDEFRYKSAITQIQQLWLIGITNDQIKTNKIFNKSASDIEKIKLQEKNLFFQSKNLIKSKLYKIFCYNESENIWSFQKETFQQFASDSKIDVNESRTPVVLLINSKEEDSIALVKNLLSGVFPEIDSEENQQQIFVYAFCDKSLSMLNYIIDRSDKVKTATKPIFLLLHVPKNKENLPNLQQIVFEIYTFLSFISDLHIIILDKNYYLDQIEMKERMKDITRWFSRRFCLNYGDPNDHSNIAYPTYNYVKIPKNKKKQKKSKKSKKSNPYSWPDDFLREMEKREEEEEEEEEEEDLDDEEYDEFWQKTDNADDDKGSEQIRIMLKNSKCIFLINDSTVLFGQNLKDNSKEDELIGYFVSQIDELTRFDYININEPVTYESFLNSFDEFLKLGVTHFSEMSIFSEVFDNFAAISLSKLNLAYINTRLCSSDWKEELHQFVIHRYAEFESNSNDCENPFILISNLNDELVRIAPPFDQEFVNKCHSVLDYLTIQVIKKSNEMISLELNKSAESHLSYLTERINDKLYWTEDQIDLITRSHFKFLKDEYLDIIKSISTDDVYINIYERNYGIIKKQMDEDKIKINEIFKPFIEKINQKKNPEKKDIKLEIKEGANYRMKETENLKEIKVTVEVNKDLKSEIEQDF